MALRSFDWPGLDSFGNGTSMAPVTRFSFFLLTKGMASEGCCENGGPSKDGPLLGCPVLRLVLAMMFTGDFKEIQNDQYGSN